LFGQVEVGGGSHFDEAKLSDYVHFGEMEGEEFVDVMGILEERFCFHVYVFEEGDDDVLKFFAHACADALLNNADYFVVVLHPQNQLSQSHHSILVRSLLKLLNHCQNVLCVLRKS
jgi:hypothetical protein